MSMLLKSLLAVLPLGALLAATFSASPPPAPARVPVAVELFTSEGCSSCPAADALLLELARTQPVAGVEIVPLSEHVDYWNRLGWTDPFSSPAFTERQRQYAAALKSSVYTPQAVVNGRAELVGSQRARLLAAVAEAAKAPRAVVELSTSEAAAANGSLPVRVAVREVPHSAPADVLLLLTETGLSSHVGRGENQGRTLAHPAVVRELRRLGRAGADGTFAATATLHPAPTWQQKNLRAVVLVQQPESRRIVGVAVLPLAQ